MQNKTAVMEVMARQRGKLLGRVAMGALPFPVLTKILGSQTWAEGLFLGIFAGLLDQWIMLTGIRVTQSYYVSPRRGLLRFKLFTLLRFINATAFIFLVIRLKDLTGGLVMGFLLIHIVFIIVLIILTRRKDGVKKGE